MEKTELKGCEELKESIQNVYAQIEDSELRVNINLAIIGTLNLWGFIQTNPQNIRLNIWKCNYYLYDFLRKNKQLKTDKNGFDEAVRKFIVSTMISANEQKV